MVDPNWMSTASVLGGRARWHPGEGAGVLHGPASWLPALQGLLGSGQPVAGAQLPWLRLGAGENDWPGAAYPISVSACPSCPWPGQLFSVYRWWWGGGDRGLADLFPHEKYLIPHRARDGW